MAANKAYNGPITGKDINPFFDDISGQGAERCGFHCKLGHRDNGFPVKDLSRYTYILQYKFLFG